MPRYLVNHVYACYTDGIHYGPWTPGETVELLEAVAEWVNRDSPGTLKLVPEKTAEREASKVPDREVKKARNTR